jgi:hypothetical protein
MDENKILEVSQGDDIQAETDDLQEDSGYGRVERKFLHFLFCLFFLQNLYYTTAV